MQGRRTRFAHKQNKLSYIDDKNNVNKIRPINSLYNKMESAMISFSYNSPKCDTFNTVQLS